MDEESKENNPSYITDGLLVYDPRIKQVIKSDNPALIFGHLIETESIITKYNLIEKEKFWKNIAEMADFCDEKIDWQED